jgi:hypothetical protein
MGRCPGKQHGFRRRRRQALQGKLDNKTAERVIEEVFGKNGK